MKTVYIELFFIDNLLINYFLLYLCARVQKIPMCRWKGVVCAVFGGVYGFLQLWRWAFLNNIFLKGLLSFIMVYFCFKPCKRDFVNLLLWFYLFSFAFAGGIFALWYLSEEDVLVRALLFLPLPLRCTGIILLVGVPLKNRLTDIFTAMKYGETGMTLKLRIFGHNESLSCCGDTGNLCTYMNIPVVFVNEKRLCNGLQNYINNFRNGNISIIDEHSDSSAEPCFSYIPYKTAGGETRVLPGIKCTDAVLTDLQRDKDLCLFVALTDHDFNGKPCLINPSLLD